MFADSKARDAQIYSSTKQGPCFFEEKKKKEEKVKAKALFWNKGKASNATRNDTTSTLIKSQ